MEQFQLGMILFLNDMSSAVPILLYEVPLSNSGSDTLSSIIKSVVHVHCIARFRYDTLRSLFVGRKICLILWKCRCRGMITIRTFQVAVRVTLPTTVLPRYLLVWSLLMVSCCPFGSQRNWQTFTWWSWDHDLQNFEGQRLNNHGPGHPPK